MSKILLPGVNGREITDDCNVIYAHEGYDKGRAKLEMYIAKKIGEHMVKHFPNRQWGVEVDVENGVLVLLCPSLSKTKGYHIHLGSYTIHDLQARCVKAAGEILERHNVSRSKLFDPDTLEALVRDVKDNVIAVDAAPERY
jgi:hypothetical protein